MKIALGVSGGIACYKAVEILRRLQDRGHDVVVLMTRNATQFVTPLTFRAISGHKVYVDLFEGPSPGHDFEGSLDHIVLAQSIDLFLVAPASANCIARLAHGIADDFLTTFHLAVTSPVVIAPAMNTHMWEHPAVQANVETLKRRGVRVIDPDTGRLAERTYGPGRLADVDRIVGVVEQLLPHRTDLKGRKILVTAGPTVEDLDPVRFISNRSSGKMGFAIADAARARGAEVVLVSGPTNLTAPDVVRVRTTAEMLQAVLDRAGWADAVIKAAAPLDFKPVRVAKQKIKKTEAVDVKFEATVDILQELGSHKNGKILVGFAAETEKHLDYGIEKLKAKNLDLIVVNPIESSDAGFSTDMNRATIVDRSGRTEELPLMSKREMADRILDRVVELLAGK